MITRRVFAMGKSKCFFILGCILTVSFVFVSGCSEKKQVKKKGEILLEYAIFSEPHYIPLEKEIVADFERKNPNIKVNMRVESYEAHNQKIQIELANRTTAPDLWLTDSAHLMEWAERGVLEDLTDFWNTRMNSKEYYEIESLKDSNGRLWGIPKEIETMGLYYNKDIFDRFGIKYPDDTWSWEDAVKAGKSLTKDIDNDGRIDIYGGPITGGFSALVANLIYQNGGSILDERGRNSTLNTPQAREAVYFAFSLYHKEKIWPTLSAYTAFGHDYFNLFRQGKVAMFLGQYCFANTLKKTMPSLNYLVVFPPKKVSRTSYYVSNLFVITKGKSSEIKEAAWRFIEHYFTIEMQKKLGEDGEGLPYHKEAVAYSMNTDYAKQHNLKIFADMLDQSVNFNINGCWRQWMDVFNKEIEKGLLGITPQEEIANNLHSGIQKVLDSYYK